jgi:ferric-dicitrate binding protein FerR (iron transport regulator)
MARKSVIDQAAEWFVELDSAERIEDKWDAFEKWLKLRNTSAPFRISRATGC